MTAEATLAQRLKRMVTENLGLKVFSLVVSIALFTVVHGSEAGQRSLHVPVVASLPPESAGKILVGELPEKVKVTVSGSRSVVNSINAMDAVQIDLSAAPRFYGFDPKLFDLPAGIDVEVSPATLSLDWEQRVEAKLPVRVQVAGAPAPSLVLVGKPTVTPSRVLVQGPRSSVESLTELPTEAIQLDGLSAGTHRLRIPLLTLPRQVTAVNTPAVTVELGLEPRSEQRRLRRLSVAVLGFAGPSLIRPPHVDVIVAAPERTLKELDPEHVIPVVEYPEDAGRGPISLPVKLRGLDENVRVVRIEPNEVLVNPR